MSASKQVSQYTLDGEFVRTYPSQTAAAKAIGVTVNHIRLAANGYNKTAGGFVWRLHAAENLGGEELPSSEYSGIGVFQYTLDGVFVKGYRSASSAGREVGGNGQKILIAARTKKNIVCGFLWRCYKVERLSAEDVAFTHQRAIAR